MKRFFFPETNERNEPEDLKLEPLPVLDGWLLPKFELLELFNQQNYYTEHFAKTNRKRHQKIKRIVR